MTGNTMMTMTRSLLGAGAFDLEATLGTMDTAQACAKEAATMLRARLDTIHKG